MEAGMEQQSASTDQAPGGDDSEASGSVATYTAGLAFALLLTAASFIVSQTHLLWAPGILAGLAVLAIAQMGVHLVFFLHTHAALFLVMIGDMLLGMMARGTD